MVQMPPSSAQVHLWLDKISFWLAQVMLYDLPILYIYEKKKQNKQCVTLNVNTFVTSHFCGTRCEFLKLCFIKRKKDK